MRGLACLVTVVVSACGSVSEKTGGGDAGIDEAGRLDSGADSGNVDGGIDGAGTRMCTDTFDDTTIDTAIWTVQDPDNTPVPISQTAGRLRINVTPNAMAGNGLTSVETFSYVGGSVQFQITAIPADGEVTSSVSIAEGGKSVRMALYPPNNYAFSTSMPNTVFTVTTADSYVRMRDDGGTTKFETSVDGINWTVRHMGVSPTMTAAKLGIGSGIDVGSGGIFEVDNVGVTVVGADCPLD